MTRSGCVRRQGGRRSDFSKATTTVQLTVIAVDTGASIVAGDTVRSKTSGDADASVHAVNVGGVTIGLSKATATMYRRRREYPRARHLACRLQCQSDAIHDGQEIKSDAGASSAPSQASRRRRPLQHPAGRSSRSPAANITAGRASSFSRVSTTPPTQHERPGPEPRRRRRIDHGERRPRPRKAPRWQRHGGGAT